MGRKAGRCSSTVGSANAEAAIGADKPALSSAAGARAWSAQRGFARHRSNGPQAHRSSGCRPGTRNPSAIALIRPSSLLLIEASSRLLASWSPSSSRRWRLISFWINSSTRSGAISLRRRASRISAFSAPRGMLCRFMQMPLPRAAQQEAAHRYQMPVTEYCRQASS